MISERCDQSKDITYRIDTEAKPNSIMKSEESNNIIKSNSITKSEASAAKAEWTSNFAPRSQTEKVRNCTQLNRDLIKEIVLSVVKSLLNNSDNYRIKQDGNKWNCGNEIDFPKLISLMNKNHLKQLKSECGGLQTLLRNHRYIFEIAEGKVKIRIPAELKNITKYKSKPCWFLSNHPDGCLHDGEICAFNHL